MSGMFRIASMGAVLLALVLGVTHAQPSGNVLAKGPVDVTYYFLPG